MLDLERLFADQMQQWPLCRQRYQALEGAARRTVRVGECDYVLQYNPARSRSAEAQVTATGVVADARPCFLCATALPAEQLQPRVTVPLSGREYIVAVNPYPITTHHFTLISATHEPQTLTGKRVWDMAALVDLMPDYLLFFNGACSGASAPDHMHFQAVPKSAVPMLQWSEDAKRQVGVTTHMPSLQDSDHCNVIVWTEGTEAYWLVIDRRKHRPWQYYGTPAAAERGEVDATAPRCLVSPASLEFCGLVPLSRQEDYDGMTATLLDDILSQCQRREPMLHVGIMDGQQIRFSAEERTHSMNYVADDQMKDVMDYGSNRVEVQEMSEYWCHAEPFTLENVTIGKQFHWQKQEDQVFRGSLHIIARQGRLHAINLVPVETYLESVVASEMSASNNLEFLKVHAIISRSWALRQLQNRRVAASSEESDMAVDAADTVVRWWDHDDHQLYDICADDHCQRYQGVTRLGSPLVAEAVRSTRGQVLVDAQGHLCDARFSKCCGGRTEVFSTCWQDRDYSYLAPVADPYCDLAHQPQVQADEVLKLVLNDYDQQTRDFHDWTVTYTRAELSALIEEKLHLGLGDILHLEAVERGASGRIKLLRVTGSQRTVVLGKELLIRKALSTTHLLSSWFDVEETTSGFVLHGHGWGHGVGLCQIGAASMSLQGFTAQQILQHYYPGAQLQTLY